ncbi:MAG: TrkH family potassium uptake protein [Alphaproteobacteria bacterium]|nr:TrkH family potassium uptake protein [Alphaproteobacteria bacterium]HRW28473.1 TrkH family potassium uptake protein [Emcibacteraceae bacterium]
MSFRLALFTGGVLLALLGFAMLIPAFLDLADGVPNATAFFMGSFISLFIGTSLFISNKDNFTSLSIREGFLITTSSWLLLSLAGALPLYYSDLNLSYTDAYFESLSGITTTGSTVLSGLDSMSRGVLLWRSILQWIGGIGIIAFGIVLLPFLKIGGMQLLQTESSDRSDKFIPQTRHLVSRLIYVYIILSFACFVTYYLLGMSGFDAVNHAMTTLSTGGYSTHDLSFGYFDSWPLQLAATFFMLLGGLPFVLHVRYIFMHQSAYQFDEQVKGFCLIVVVTSIPIILWLLYHHVSTFSEAFVLTAFNVMSVITTTGYASTDYTAWGPFTTGIFFFLTYLGSCAGSTSGGLKVMRLLVFLKGSKQQMNQLIYPNGIFQSFYQGRPVDNSLLINVIGFISFYVLLNAFITLALTWVGLDVDTALSGAATAIANVGPGIGDIIGPSGNFSTLPDDAKWVLCLGMFLGRLEILTVLILFSPRFWKN